MKIKTVIATDVQGSECEDEFEIDDDASDEEIEEEAREVAMNRISWSWWKIAVDTPAEN